MIKIPVMINDIKATIIMERLPNYRRFRGQLINSLKQETSLVKLECFIARESVEVTL